MTVSTRGLPINTIVAELLLAMIGFKKKTSTEDRVEVCFGSILAGTVQLEKWRSLLLEF